MIGIIAAMEEEKDAFLHLMEDAREEEKEGYSFYRGQIQEKDCVLVKCGIGKANAAMITTLLILEYKPILIVNCGCAGSLNMDVQVGDIVIGQRIADWDIEVPEPAWNRGFDCAKLSFNDVS